ncbi:MAG: hypothetical protein ABW185_21455 [Sedimenticola sp.]
MRHKHQLDGTGQEEEARRTEWQVTMIKKLLKNVSFLLSQLMHGG